MDLMDKLITLPGDHIDQRLLSACRPPGTSRRCATRPSSKGYSIIDPRPWADIPHRSAEGQHCRAPRAMANVQSLLNGLTEEQDSSAVETSCRADFGFRIQRVLQACLTERILDPRSADHPRRHRRDRLARPLDPDDRRARPRPPGGTAPGPGRRHPAAADASAAMGNATSPEAMVGDGESRHTPPWHLHLQQSIRRGAEGLRAGRAAGRATGADHLAVDPPHVRAIVERFRSQTTVLSQAEIHPRARLEDGGKRTRSEGRPRGAESAVKSAKLFRHMQMVCRNMDGRHSEPAPETTLDH